MINNFLVRRVISTVLWLDYSDSITYSCFIACVFRKTILFSSTKKLDKLFARHGKIKCNPSNFGPLNNYTTTRSIRLLLWICETKFTCNKNMFTAILVSDLYSVHLSPFCTKFWWYCYKYCTPRASVIIDALHPVSFFTVCHQNHNYDFKSVDMNSTHHSFPSLVVWIFDRLKLVFRTGAYCMPESDAI